jgi:hypothetical protein
VASFADVDGNADPTKYSAIIDWGDGHSTQGVLRVSDPLTHGQIPFAVFGSHTYAAVGNFTIRVTIHDADGDSTDQPRSTARPMRPRRFTTRPRPVPVRRRR